MNIIGEKCYAFGGTSESTGDFYNRMLVIDCVNYNIEIFQQCIGDAPNPRAHHKSVVYGSKLLFYGGLNLKKVFNDYFTFNTGSNDSMN